MRFTISRVFFNTRKRVVWATGRTHEQALAHIHDPNCASKTCTTDDARRYTARHGEWFDILEPEPKRSRLLAWLTKRP